MKPSVALVINTCNQPHYLARVLQAVSSQTCPPDEVILADDGSGDETRHVFEQWSRTQSFVSRHVWQEKKGFRRARILNASIAQTRSDYVIFLDGDTLPHPHFTADHRALARRKCFIQGHRVLVSQKASQFFGTGRFTADRRRAFFTGQLKGFKHIFRWLIPFRQIVPSLDGVRGCNLSAWRADLVAINGYNEDYSGWGCEDLDLAQRLMNSGVRRLDVRGHGLCYHLWHPLLDRSQLATNQKILEETTRHHQVVCRRGLDGHLEAGAPERRAAVAPLIPLVSKAAKESVVETQTAWQANSPAC